MEVEKTDGLKTPFLECENPSYGVLVFTSTIPGLQFKLNLQGKLKGQAYRQQENRYILCVEPTDKRYIVTITCPTCEAVNYTVEEIPPTEPQYFRIKDKKPPVIPLSAQEQYDLGMAEYNRGNLAQSETRYRNAVDLTKANPVFEFLQALGDVCIKRNQYADAVTFLMQASVVRPNNAAIHHLLGTAYFELGRYENAAGSFKAAVDLAANNTQYQNDLQKALKANPQKAKGYLDMGNAYMVQNNYAEALRYYREAANADPQNNSYQTAIRTAETRINQERYMISADAAYKTAKATPEPNITYVQGQYGKQISASSQSALDVYKKRYQQMLDEIEKAKALGALPQYMQESVAFYEYDSQLDLAGGCAQVSAGWVNDFLKRNPETPFRKQIEACKTIAGKKFHGEIGLSAAYNNLLGISGFIGFRLYNCDNLVNFHIALQYTYYYGGYYDTSDGSTKPEKDNSWDLTANQISLPVTLKLNIVRIGKNTTKPSSVFIAATAQPNFNINATCFGETSSDFVEKLGYSGTVSIGWSNKTFSVSAFARNNFTDMFVRNEIMKFDNQNKNNDYTKLDTHLENKMMFGASLGYYF